MKQLLKDISITVLLIILSTISLFGVLIPQNTPVQVVGPMQFAPFEDGLSLFQNQRGYFYRFSPFNDYVITPEGSRSTFLSQEEIHNKFYTSTYTQSVWKKTVTSIQGYFRTISPSMTFQGKNRAEYTTEINGNKATISRTLYPNYQTVGQIIGSTMTFNSDDFVFDSTGNLYNFQLDEDILAFSNFYGITLTPVLDELLIQVPNKTLFIVNPHVAGVIVLKASPNQTIWINRDAKLIEVQEAVDPRKNAYNAQLELEVYENVKDII